MQNADITPSQPGIDQNTEYQQPARVQSNFLHIINIATRMIFKHSQQQSANHDWNSIKMYKDDFTNIRFMIGRQIQQRLCDKGLIIDFMIKMENLKLDQTRDIKLSRILDENNDEVISTIIVDFKLNKFREVDQVRHNITIEDLSK